MREKRELLEHEAETALVHRHAGQIAPVEAHFARVSILQTGHDAQQRRLAAA